MKKVFSILLVVVMLVCFMATSASAAEGGVSGTGATVSKTGDQATVSFNVSRASGFGAYKIYVTYDASKLTYVSHSANIAESAFIAINAGTPGKIVVTYGNTENVTSNSFSIKFTVNGDCSDSYTVSAAFDMFAAYDEKAEQVNLSGSNGSATITVNHDWVAGTPVAATCTEDGYTPYTCSVCGVVENRDIVAAAHKYEAVVTEPDCVNGGYTTYTCSVCGDSYVADEVNALGHTPGEIVIENATEAVCDKGGSYDEVVYCTVCGEELSRETVNVDATGHTAGDPVKENVVEATCKEAGSYDEVIYCSICGEELSREKKTIDKLTTHTPGKPVRENEVPATCKEAGSYEEVVYCSVCGEELSREKKTIEKVAHTPGEPVIENKVDSTCTKKGSYEEVTYCSVCGEEISRVKQTIEKKPHVDKNKDDKCDICGADMDDDEPKNGDITPYFVMPVVLVSICAAAAYVSIKRKNAR